MSSSPKSMIGEGVQTLNSASVISAQTAQLSLPRVFVRMPIQARSSIAVML